MLLSLFQRLAALVSLALLALGGWIAWDWWQAREALNVQPNIFETDAWPLWLAAALVAWSFVGRLPMGLLLARKGDDAARMRRLPGETLETPDGARLHVERTGPADAPVLVFVHGWGLDAGIWWEARNMLSERYQVVTYDLAGLGKSKQPRDGGYSLDRFAEDLMAVVASAAPRRVILVGHSIGGMTVQTFCQRYPETLGRQVQGIVLENTTPTDPTHTTVLGEALHALEPVLKPLMHLDIWLQPLVWAMNWQSYLSGSTHLAMRFGGFGTQPTRAQLNQVSLAATRNSPAVQAKGNLAMMNWAGVDPTELRVPALVFIGSSDIVTVPDAGESIVWKAPQARPMLMGDGGHLGPLELAAHYNSEIARFADEVFTRGAQSADRVGSPSASPAEAEGMRRPPQEPRPYA